MKGAVLLVTWMLSGQPATSYQVDFDSMQKCTVARDAIYAEQERLTRQAKGPKLYKLPDGSTVQTGPEKPPRVSAVCAER